MYDIFKERIIYKNDYVGQLFVQPSLKFNKRNSMIQEYVDQFNIIGIQNSYYRDKTFIQELYNLWIQEILSFNIIIAIQTRDEILIVDPIENKITELKLEFYSLEKIKKYFDECKNHEEINIYNLIETV